MKNLVYSSADGVTLFELKRHRLRTDSENLTNSNQREHSSFPRWNAESTRRANMCPWSGSSSCIVKSPHPPSRTRTQKTLTTQSSGSHIPRAPGTCNRPRHPACRCGCPRRTTRGVMEGRVGTQSRCEQTAVLFVVFQLTASQASKHSDKRTQKN